MKRWQTRWAGLDGIKLVQGRDNRTNRSRGEKSESGLMARRRVRHGANGIKREKGRGGGGAQSRR